MRKGYSTGAAAAQSSAPKRGSTMKQNSAGQQQALLVKFRGARDFNGAFFDSVFGDAKI